MKMVTEPPRSNQPRSPQPGANAPRPATSARKHPGQVKRNPAVKAAPKRVAKAASQPAKQAPKKLPQAKAPQPVANKQAPKPAQPTARSMSGGKGGIRNLKSLFSPTALKESFAGLLANRNDPKALTALALAALAVIGLVYGIVFQGRAVSHAEQLEGYQARVITAVVVDQGFGSTTVDVNGEELKVAQMKDAVPVGQPIRVRVNPSNPNYVVDARLEPQEAISGAKRSRLIAILVSILVGAISIYLLLGNRFKR